MIFAFARVFGRTFTQVISQLEKSIDAEAVLDSTALPVPPSKALPGTVTDSPSVSAAEGDSSVHPGAALSQDSVVGSGQCRIEKLPASVTVLYDETQRQQHHQRHAICRLEEYDQSSIMVEADAILAGLNHQVTPSERKDQSDEPSHPSANDSPRPGTNGSASGATGTDGAGANAVKPNTTAPASPPLPVPSINTGASTQGLGRLESIFVRITKKSK